MQTYVSLVPFTLLLFFYELHFVKNYITYPKLGITFADPLQLFVFYLVF
jgi:hypothetical protein